MTRRISHLLSHFPATFVSTDLFTLTEHSSTGHLTLRCLFFHMASHASFNRGAFGGLSLIHFGNVWMHVGPDVGDMWSHCGPLVLEPSCPGHHASAPLSNSWQVMRSHLGDIPFDFGDYTRIGLTKPSVIENCLISRLRLYMQVIKIETVYRGKNQQ